MNIVAKKVSCPKTAKAIELAEKPHDALALLAAGAIQERDELYAVLREVIEAGLAYARTTLTADVAVDNFSDPHPELREQTAAISRLSTAEANARSVLAKYGQQGEKK
jgi:hypothetical protein